MLQHLAVYITLGRAVDTLLSLLASPGILIGALGGIALAAAFHWLAPAGTDTTTAGALLIVVSAAVGLAWELIFSKGSK